MGRGGPRRPRCGCPPWGRRRGSGPACARTPPCPACHPSRRPAGHDGEHRRGRRRGRDAPPAEGVACFPPAASWPNPGRGTPSPARRARWSPRGASPGQPPKQPGETVSGAAATRSGPPREATPARGRASAVPGAGEAPHRVRSGRRPGAATPDIAQRPPRSARPCGDPWDPVPAHRRWTGATSTTTCPATARPGPRPSRSRAGGGAPASTPTGATRSRLGAWRARRASLPDPGDSAVPDPDEASAASGVPRPRLDRRVPESEWTGWATAARPHSPRRSERGPSDRAGEDRRGGGHDRRGVRGRGRKDSRARRGGPTAPRRRPTARTCHRAPGWGVQCGPSMNNDCVPSLFSALSEKPAKTASRPAPRASASVQ